ncbi:hypothetical protein ACJRO7_020972, partial [Eucalyptus globulus]
MSQVQGLALVTKGTALPGCSDVGRLQAHAKDKAIAPETAPIPASVMVAPPAESDQGWKKVKGGEEEAVFTKGELTGLS